MAYLLALILGLALAVGMPLAAHGQSMTCQSVGSSTYCSGSGGSTTCQSVGSSTYCNGTGGSLTCQDVGNSTYCSGQGTTPSLPPSSLPCRYTESSC